MTGGFEVLGTSPLIERRYSGRRRVLGQPRWGMGKKKLKIAPGMPILH
jgi:hypothetical protein